MAAHPENHEIVYLGRIDWDVSTEKSGLFRSRDGGREWELLDHGMAVSLGSRSNKLVFAPEDPGRIFLLHNAGIYEINDRDALRRSPRSNGGSDVGD